MTVELYWTSVTHEVRGRQVERLLTPACGSEAARFAVGPLRRRLARKLVADCKACGHDGQRFAKLRLTCTDLAVLHIAGPSHAPGG